MKNIQTYLDESLTDESYNTTIINNVKIVSNLDDKVHEIVVRMWKTDKDSYGDYSREYVDEDEIDNYDWDDEDQDLIDKAKDENGEVYIIKSGVGEFEQPIGVVIELKK